MPEFLYRLDDGWQVCIDFEDTFHSCLNLSLCKLPVVRTTPCGAWVRDGFRERFVNSKAKKRYAWPTIDEAVTSFIARKEKQLWYLRRTTRRVEEALAAARRRYDRV